MIVKWKVFRASFPYICTSCGEFANSEKEFCEKCGKKGTLRNTSREDYERYIEKAKAKASVSKAGIVPKKVGNNFSRVKRKKTIKMILICFCVFLVIDIIGFIILMNILGISFDELGENLWLFWGLVGFTMVMFVIIVVVIYFSYYTKDYLWWIDLP
jgi:hypothetical protein